MPTTSPLLSGPWRGLPPLPPRPYFLHCSISANTENVVLDEITRCRLMIGCETRTSSKRSLALQLLSPPAYRSKLLYLVVLLLRICRGTDKTASCVMKAGEQIWDSFYKHCCFMCSRCTSVPNTCRRAQFLGTHSHVTRPTLFIT